MKSRLHSPHLGREEAFGWTAPAVVLFAALIAVPPAPAAEPLGVAPQTNVINPMVIYITPADDAVLEIAPQTIVSNTLAYSRQLRIAGKQIQEAEAREAGARSQSWPKLTLDGKANFFEGLQETFLGPGMVIAEIPERYVVGASITQPAYTGGRIKSQREGARFQQLAARDGRRVTEAELTFRSLTAYWNWSKSYHALEAMQAAVARMEGHAKNIRSLHEAGLATENERLATEVQLDQTRLAEEETKRRLEQNLANLAFLTGQELPANSTPHQPAEPLDPIPDSVAALAVAARAGRPELAARSWESRAAESQVKASRADYYPQISLMARYEEANPSLLNFPPKEEWQGVGFIGVSANWNIFDFGSTKAKVAEARAKAEEARLNLEQLNDQILLEIRTAWIRLADARERLRGNERVEASARRNLQVATDLWKNGLSRHSDVLDAHSQLTSAQYQIIVARADLILARTDLDRAAGQLKAEGH